LGARPREHAGEYAARVGAEDRADADLAPPRPPARYAAAIVTALSWATLSSVYTREASGGSVRYLVTRSRAS